MVNLSNLFTHPDHGQANVTGTLHVGRFTPNGLELNFAGELPSRLQANYAVQGVAFHNDSPNERGQHAYNFLLASGVAPSVNHVLASLATDKALQKAGFTGPSEIHYSPAATPESHNPGRTPVAALDQPHVPSRQIVGL